MDLLNRIKVIKYSELDETQLDKYLDDIRDSLAKTERLFLSYQIIVVISIVIYHLIVYGSGKPATFAGIQLTDTELFRRTFLVFPAGLLAAMTCIGYLRILQRETYDFLIIDRYPPLGKAGLHELRLPSDFVLGAFMLKENEGVLGRWVAGVIMYIVVWVFFIIPSVYIIYRGFINIQTDGYNDILSIIASVTSIILCVCSMIVIFLGGRTLAITRAALHPTRRVI